MRSWRILRAIGTVSPSWGGPVEGLKQISRVHQRSGHRIEVVTLDSATDPWVQECELTVHPTGPRLGRYGFTKKFIPWLRENRQSYDVVIVDGVWQYHGLGTWATLRNSLTPYFVMPHGGLDPWLNQAYPWKRLKKWLYWPWAEYRVLRDARAVLFTCEEERRRARRSFALHRWNEVVTGYGTAEPPGTPAQQIGEFLNQFPHLAFKRLLLYLGRIHQNKGVDLLIQALARVLEERHTLQGQDGPPWHLVIAGPGANPRYLERMRSLATSRLTPSACTFTGMLEGDLKWGALRAAELVALPSHQDSFGMVVVEAMACGTPVLVTTQVGVHHDVRRAGAGVVVPDTLPDLEAGLRTWLRIDRGERESRGRAARTCFETQFSIAQAAQRVIDLCTSLLPAHRTSCVGVGNRPADPGHPNRFSAPDR